MKALLLFRSHWMLGLKTNACSHLCKRQLKHYYTFGSTIEKHHTSVAILSLLWFPNGSFKLLNRVKKREKMKSHSNENRHKHFSIYNVNEEWSLCCAVRILAGLYCSVAPFNCGNICFMHTYSILIHSGLRNIIEYVNDIKFTLLLHPILIYLIPLKSFHC